MMYYMLPTSCSRGKVKGTRRCREEEAFLRNVKLVSATNRHRQSGFPLVITKKQVQSSVKRSKPRMNVHVIRACTKTPGL